MSDLIRAHEGNPDFHDDDPEKIHWAKFNMMGRFIDVVTQCQRVCRESGAFNFPDRPPVWNLLMFKEQEHLMDEDVSSSYYVFLEIVVPNFMPLIASTCTDFLA